MFDKRDLLQERLRPVVRTLQAVRFWRGSALILLLATLVAWSLVPPVRSGQLVGMTAAWVIFAAVAAGIAAVAITAGRSFLNPSDIATRIERRFPSLGQRLLTAVQLPLRSQNASLGYLQSRVVQEAHDHSQTHRWADVVSPKQVLLSRLAGVISLAAMAAMLWILATSQPLDGAASLGPLSQIRTGMVRVEPGHVELERGTSLLVTARFDGREAIGGPVELLCIAEDGSQRRFPMKQTLDDPILSAFIGSVDTSLRYQVVSQRYQSDVFTAEVFDFPALTRSDAELDYPSYTGLERKRIEDTVRVTAVEGTQLGWELNLNKPVAKVTLIDADGNRLALQASAEDPLRYRSNFEMTRTQRWRLELVDEAGRENKFPPELVARVLPNHPPTLKLVAGGDAAVSPLEEFPVAVQVRDDHSVQRFGLSYTFPGGKSADLVLGEAIPRGQTRRGDHLIDFESLGAEPDQLLAYHFWAEDFATDGSSRRTHSDLHFAEVRPLEEIYRENESPDAGSMQSQQQQQQGGGAGAQAEELAELQKQIINATWKVLRRELGTQRSAEFSGDVESIRAGQTDALQQLEELASEVADEQSLEFIEQATASMNRSLEQLQRAAAEAATEPLNDAVEAQQAAYQSLLGLRAREFQVSRSQQQSQQQGSSSSSQQRQQQLDELELKNDENRYETQSQASPEEETQQEGREQREVIDRLRELAQRQEDINEQLAELQSALELAENEEEKREIERQLKRLRDQQQDMLRDADELAERLQQTQNQSQGQQSEPGQDAAEQLEQTRENIRQAGEALSQNDASEALAAGTRAERQLDEMREELRQQAAGNFEEAMRQIRSAAQQLDEQQQEIAQQMNVQPPSDNQPGLRTQTPENDVVEDLQAQRQQLGQLLEQVQETVQQAESSEPLLAQNLYDTYRNTQQQKVDRKLSDTAELLRRGMQEPAEEMQQQSGEAIRNLRERLEDAAESVLGDQTKALERALGELEQLQDQLEGEIDEATESTPQADQRGNGENGSPSPSQQASAPEGAEPAEEPSQRSGQGSDEPAEQQTGEPADDGSGPQPGPPSEEPSGQSPGGRPASEEPGQPGGQQPGQPGQPGGQQPGQEPSDQPGGQQPGGGGAGGMIEQIAEAAEAEGDQRGGAPGGGERGGGDRRGGGLRQPAPLTGEGYRQWSDRLRDVEQMIEDPTMRSEATRIRERARETRGEFRRRSQPPQWDEVEEMIARPLRELTKNVAEELLRRSADRHAVVPIDRDPVPDRFSEAVRRYYESLGSGL